MAAAPPRPDAAAPARPGQAAQVAAGRPHAVPRQPAQRAGEEFEAMFLAQMLQPIFAGLESDALFGGGSGERVYKQMLVEQYGKALARAGGVGIADAVQAEILKLQEVER